MRTSESWSDVFADLDRPVLGDPEQYDTAESNATDLRTATESCVEEFGRINSADGSDQLQGQAANQLTTLVGEIDGSLSEVPPVFTTLEQVFESHARQLRALHTSTTIALAHARARWSALQTAQDEQSDAQAALTAIEQQTEDLRSAAPLDPTLTSDLIHAEQQQSDARTAATNASTAVSFREEELEKSRAEYNQLVTDETELIDRTVRAIGNIDLGDLKDPNYLLEKFAGLYTWQFDLLAGIAVDYYKAIDAVIDGRFQDALWHLSDALAGVLTVLAIVALIVAVVATGGALAVAIATIALGLAFTKLLIDSFLLGSQHPHPETGQTRTWQEVAVDAVLLIFDAYTFNSTSVVVRPLKTVLKDVAQEVVIGIGVGELAGPWAAGLGSDPLTTDPSAWEHPSIVELAEDPLAGAAGGPIPGAELAGGPIPGAELGGLIPGAEGGSSIPGVEGGVTFPRSEGTTTIPDSAAMRTIDAGRFKVAEWPTVGPVSDAGSPEFQLAEAN